MKDQIFSETQIQSQQKNIAILGCGYVGKAIALYWRQKQHNLTVTTTNPERISELQEVADQVVIMRGDDLEAVRSVIKNQETIFISIAPTSNVRVDAKTYEKTYIPTMENLKLALENNHTVKQIIYISSSSVYGNQEGNFIDENTPVKIEDEYGEILVKAEQILLKIAQNNCKISILRLGGIYGPKRELNQRFKKLAGKTLPGDGNNFIAWIHLDDIVNAVDFVHQNQLEGIYNLVNDFNMTTKQILDKVCEQQGLEKVSWNPSETGTSSLNARISNKKIKNAGYKFIYSDKII